MLAQKLRGPRNREVRLELVDGLVRREPLVTRATQAPELVDDDARERLEGLRVVLGECPRKQFGEGLGAFAQLGGIGVLRVELR